jgi:hypothetical protein
MSNTVSSAVSHNACQPLLELLCGFVANRKQNDRQSGEGEGLG